MACHSEETKQGCCPVDGRVSSNVNIVVDHHVNRIKNRYVHNLVVDSKSPTVLLMS